ncbi:HAMP domain-containing protein, partial [Myxococcota bacterium]|nr:HAMP domain-containing protein [Myxococcota bacterium]
MKLRIRHKLAFWMTIIGIIPSFIASFMAISLIVGRLKSNKRQETAKTLRIGTNLIMDHVESIKKATLGLSKHRTTFLYFTENDLSFQNMRLLQKELEGMGNGVIHILEPDRRLTGSLIIGEPPGRMSVMDLEVEYEKSLEQSTEMIGQVLNDYAQTVDIISITRNKGKPTAKEMLFVRAAAPILDKQYNLKGAIVVTMALDEVFCQNISTILGSHIVLFPFHGDPNDRRFGKEFVSSFPYFEKSQESIPPISSSTLIDFIKGGTDNQLTETHYMGVKYSVAMNSLHNLKGDDLGIFAIATDIDTIQKGQSEAIFTLKWITVMSLAVAVLLALLFARTLSNPLGRLLISVQDVARGKLETNIKSNSTDEIGDLAKGFNKMVFELRSMRQKQTEQISEIQTLHEINGAISVQVGLGNVVSQAMKSISIAIQCENIAFWFKGDDETFSLIHHEGIHWKDLKNLRILDEPLYRAGIKGGELFHISDVQSHEGLTRQGKLRGEVMVIPLSYQGQAIAAVMLNRWEPGSSWTDVHFRILRTVADQLSVYIVNAQMFEKISSFNEALELMVQERTVELQKANVKLEQTLDELKNTQVQVLISER